ncbi:hemoglobin [Mycolicibacterium iranicum]|uniref:Group 1 truncated hemoglobin n=1 Tax=Mycolicibacterium iranicum TaxID=912594 RepID=A0A839QE19_MYCIR|nr:group 1 truncated hemoglobin [Mycolicibacterium iranicum]MBB2992735.1 hemoglobin [Mycolicibacterium iranicum]
MGIYDQIGGSAAVTAAVDDLYRRVIADPGLSHYFDGVDMKRLKARQRSFLAAALGGHEPALVQDMREAHSHLDIAPRHFDRAVDHLVETLSDLGVRGSVLDRVGARLAPLKAEVVAGRAARAG